MLSSMGILPRALIRLRGASLASARSLFIKIESTPNPDSLKFRPEEREVLPASMGTGLHFSDVKDARGSKFVRRLLKYSQVTSVFLGPDFISVNKVDGVAWDTLKPIVLGAIMDAYAEKDASGVPIVENVEPPPDTAPAEDDDEVVAMIKELMETRIRPAVQEDGGDIFFVCVIGCAAREAGVRLAGSCVGCPSSSATLKNGVENMLMHYIPEVRKIEQVLSPAEEEGSKVLATLEDRLGAAGADP
jgi:Fe-S cluster biogenesis protein NfuA